jgi:hypothetical protein
LFALAAISSLPIFLQIRPQSDGWLAANFNLLVGLGLFGGLLGGLACLNLAWRHFIWRRGRIDAVLLLGSWETISTSRARSSAGLLLSSVGSPSVTGMINATRCVIPLQEMREGKPRQFSIQASAHNFSPTRYPRAVWLVYPAFPLARPMLVADVAPKQWVHVAVPDAIADALEQAATGRPDVSLDAPTSRE